VTIKRALCPGCEAIFELPTHTGLRIASAVVGGVLLGTATGSPIWAVVGGAVAYWGSGRVLEYIDRRCQDCGARADIAASPSEEAEEEAQGEPAEPRAATQQPAAVM
jgi:hypothetical protein